MKRTPIHRLLLASIAPLAATAFAAGAAPAPDCAKCSDIPRVERELAQQRASQAAFREFTYDAVGPRQQASSIQALQAAHAQLFSQMVSGGKKAKGKGRKVVAQPALETDPNDENCAIVEVLPGGKRVPLDEAKYRKKLCLFADYLIEHEKNHVQKCKRARAEGLMSEFENPIFVAELEVKAYQAGIDLLEAQLASLKSRCTVATSAPQQMPDQALASAADVPALQQESQRIAQALQKGWS